MRIVFIVDRYPPRPHTGIGTFVQTVARGLNKRGHTVTVVEIDDGYHEHTDEGIPVVAIQRSKLRYIGNLITRLRLRNWLMSRFKAGEIDIIEVPDYPGFLPFGVGRCATVVRLHQSGTISDMLSGVKKAKGISFYEKCTLRMNSNWIGVSGHIVGLTEKVFGVHPKRSAVIHNALPPRPTRIPEIPNLPENFVLYASQVSRRKGALVLADAARDFLSTRADLHLVFVGGCLSENGSSARDQILELAGPQLARRIHFLGQVSRDEVLACMKRAKAFAFPTQIDCFPTVVLEAMSCGVPVVFTQRAPGPEMITDGVSGLLVDPISPRDVSDKIGRLLDDPSLASRLAQNAYEGVSERFSLEKCLNATERFYEECLKI